MIKRIRSSNGRTLFPRSAERSGRITRSAERSSRIKWLLAGIMAVIALMGAAFAYSNRREPLAPTEIFAGITYGCRQLDTTSEGSGLVHWAIVDLAAPGIELYVTPLNPTAVARGWQYRLRRIGEVVDNEHLAVAVNGTYFWSNSGGWPRKSGDLASSVQTVVADGIVSYGSGHAYFLWFDEKLTPHLIPSSPPPSAELAKARWGIGGQSVGLWNGKVHPGTSRDPDARTAIAIDPQRRLLFLAIGQHISPRLLLHELADLGAKDGMLLDGGDSSSMAIGKGAAGVSAGVLSGGWRPVATFFGVRAQPVLKRHQSGLFKQSAFPTTYR
jgi:hypothetical protein